MSMPDVVSRETWLAARKALLVKEKQMTRARDALNDNIGHLAHLHARDTTLVVVSRAPGPELDAFRKRMGWSVPFFSSHGSDFNDDFHATLDRSVAPVELNFMDEAELQERGEDYKGEVAGVSVFLRDGGHVSHTYSSYEHGTDILNGTLNYLDLTPLGRQEFWEEPPGRADAPASGWWRLHDEYPAGDADRGAP